jgi:hypothetical protein
MAEFNNQHKALKFSIMEERKLNTMFRKTISHRQEKSETGIYKKLSDCKSETTKNKQDWKCVLFGVLHAKSCRSLLH